MTCFSAACYLKFTYLAIILLHFEKNRQSTHFIDKIFLKLNTLKKYKCRSICEKASKFRPSSTLIKNYFLTFSGTRHETGKQEKG